MARRLYTLIFALLLPFILIRLWWRGRKAPDYRLRWRERLGVIPRLNLHHQPLWIHAVSVGETLAAVPLVNKIRQQHPHLPVIITTMTPTGAARVKSVFADKVNHVYAPYDLPGCINRFLDCTRPRGLIVMETELWPNWLYCCGQRQIPCILANGRLSAESARGYQRLKALVRPMLQRFRWLAVQECEHKRRFIELGAEADSVAVVGSIKFDIEVSQQLIHQGQSLREQWGDQRLVIVAGSTHAGEEEVLLEVLQTVLATHPQTLLILVPRHPERFGPVADSLAQQGWSYSRWSAGTAALAKSQVLVVDTMGELMMFYAAADIAFVGGSLIHRGGHNPLEPAALAVPVVMGHSVFNFQEICDHLSKAGALTMVGRSDLVSVFLQLAADKQQRLQQGAKGKAFVGANKGALNRLYSGLLTELDL